MIGEAMETYEEHIAEMLRLGGGHECASDCPLPLPRRDPRADQIPTAEQPRTTCPTCGATPTRGWAADPAEHPSGSPYAVEDRSMLGEPPWKPTDPALIAWESAHGHDVRLDCDRRCDVYMADLERRAEHPSGSPQTEAHAAIRSLAAMKPDDEWGDKFYAALGALWRVVKWSEIPAMPEPPHVVMARLIEDVAWAAAARREPLDVERLKEAMREQHALLMPDVPPMSPKMLDHIASDIGARYARLSSTGGTSRSEAQKHAAWCWLSADHQGMCEGDQ